MSLQSSASCNYSSLREASRTVTRVYDGALAPAGVSMHQYEILSTAGRSGPSSLGRLAEAMRLDRTTLSHLIKPLVGRGLLAIGSQPEDARRKIVSLSVTGAAIVLRARPLWQEAQRQFESAFGPDRADSLRATLALLNATRFGPE